MTLGAARNIVKRWNTDKWLCKSLCEDFGRRLAAGDAEYQKLDDEQKKIDAKLKKLSSQLDKIARQKQVIVQKYADAEFEKEKARYEEARKLLAEADKVVMSLMKNRAENTPYNEEQSEN